MSLVIKNWKVTSTPAPNQPYVNIQGRQSGFIGFVLSLVGMDPTVKFTLEDGKITYSASSWSGQKKVMIPLSKVATGYFGYARPWKEALVVGAVLMPFFFLGLIAGPLYYFLNKRMEFGVRSVGGENFPIAFKRSIIEGQNIDENAGLSILNILETHISEEPKHKLSTAA